MISRIHAKKEIMRLSACNFFPSMNPAGLGELVDSLQLRAKSNEHATLVISEAIDCSASCPTPADISRLCAEVGKRAESFPAPCDRCIVHGGNFMLVTTMHKGKLVDMMTRCDCSRGRLLAAKEEEEKRKSAGM